MANAFKTNGWQILAEVNAFNTSRAYNAPLYAPLVSKALASAGLKSIGHPLVLKALGNYLFQNPSELKAALYIKHSPSFAHV